MTREIVRALQERVGRPNAFALDAAIAVDTRRIVESVVDNETRYSAVARPDDVESLQRVMQFASARGLGVTVQPNAAGNGLSLAPQGGEAIVVDLRRMNHIVEVNASGAYALIEPGVTFEQMRAHLQGQESPLWIDCDRDPQHSIAGDIWARRYGYTAYGDRLLMQCGFEVVLGTGEVLRTGMGALPKSTTWQLFKYNFGPYLDGLLTRTNLAALTKVGLWLMPAPPHYLPFRLTLRSDESLAAAIEQLRPLLIGNTVPGPVRIGHGFYEMAPHYRRSKFVRGGTVDARAAFAEGSVGAWNGFGALYGTPEIVQILWSAVRESLASVPGAQVIPGAGQVSADPIWALREGLMRGEPPRAAPRFRHWAGHEYMRVTCVAPMEGSAALKLWELVRQSALDEECLCEYTLHSRTMLLDVHLPYDAGRAASASRTAARALSLAEAVGSAGYGIAGESVELRHVFNKHFAKSPVSRFSASLQQAFDAQPSGARTSGA